MADPVASGDAARIAALEAGSAGAYRAAGAAMLAAATDFAVSRALIRTSGSMIYACRASAWDPAADRALQSDAADHQRCAPAQRLEGVHGRQASADGRQPKARDTVVDQNAIAIPARIIS